MSFILDALKKSEMERQQQSIPGLMDARVIPRRGRLPVWAIALGILLAVNLAVLTFVLMRKSGPAAAPAAIGDPGGHAARLAANASADATAASHSQPFSPMDPAPVYAPEIPVAPQAAAPSETMVRAQAAAPSESTVRAQASAPYTAHSGSRADPLLTDAAADGENPEVLPSISQISLTGAQALPELHLDVHVYSTKPAERFVYINMRKYHEGGRLQEGPIVETIRRDGVVLDYQGLRFILPRQS